MAQGDRHFLAADADLFDGITGEALTPDDFVITYEMEPHGRVQQCGLGVNLSVTPGVLGPLDTAIIEVTGIREDGALIPSSSVGNNKSWLDQARRVILEVNRWQNPAIEGMHDIYYGTRLPPDRVPIPLVRPDQRIGTPYFACDPDKIVAIVETDAPDRNLPFAAPDDTALAIAGHIIEFLTHEVARGRLPAALLPIQSGVGNIANAVLSGLIDAPFEPMTAFTEVIQDGMIDLLDDRPDIAMIEHMPAPGQRLIAHQ